MRSLPTTLVPMPYQADAANSGIDGWALGGLCGLFSEEEIQFVIIPFGAVRDELGMDK